MSHQVAEYRAAGMDGFIAKPLDIDKLAAALEALDAARPAEGARPRANAG